MIEPGRPAAAGRFTLLAVAAVLLGVSLAAGVAFRFGHQHIDLDVYRAGARAWLDGVDLYDTSFPVQGIRLPFTYPPLAAVVFAPLAMLGSTAAAAVMFLLSLAALAGTVWLVLSRIRPGLDRVTAATLTVLATAVALQLEPVTETLGFGQVNLILMFVVTADLLVDTPWWPRGMLIGIAAAVKLTPAAFLLYFLLARDTRAAVTVVLSAAAATGLGFLLAAHDSLAYWLGGTLGATGRIGAPYFASNQSWKGVLTRLDPEASTLLWLAGAAVAVVLAAILMHRLLAAGRTSEAMIVNAVAVLLCSPVSWSHHWVWIVPALMLAVDAIVRGTARAVTIPATLIVTAIFAVGPHWYLPHRRNRELDWSWWQQPIGDAYWLVGVVVLSAGVLWYRPTPAPGAVGDERERLTGAT